MSRHRTASVVTEGGIVSLATGQVSVPFAVALSGPPLIVLAGIPTGGVPGVPFVGSFELPVPLTNPAFAGITFYTQGGVGDPAHPSGMVLTNGMKTTIFP